MDNAKLERKATGRASDIADDINELIDEVNRLEQELFDAKKEIERLENENVLRLAVSGGLRSTKI